MDSPKPVPVARETVKVPTEAPHEFPVTVRTTFQPTQDLEVDTLAEWTDLSRQGLLAPGHDGRTHKEN